MNTKIKLMFPMLKKISKWYQAVAFNEFLTEKEKGFLLFLLPCVNHFPEMGLQPTDGLFDEHCL